GPGTTDKDDLVERRCDRRKGFGRSRLYSYNDFLSGAALCSPSAAFAKQDMMLKAGRFAAAQIVGDRDRQEDDFAILDLGDDHHERLMLVLADGMGGHAAAAQAAHRAIEHFCRTAQASDGPLAERLQPALIGANAALALSAAGDPALAGSGCTLLAAAIEDGTLSWISVGDSLLFSLRGHKLRLLNKE